MYNYSILKRGIAFLKPTPERISVPRTEYLILLKLYLGKYLSSSSETNSCSHLSSAENLRFCSVLVSVTSGR